MRTHLTEAARREPGWVGRDERTEVLVEAIIRRADGTQLNVVVHDLSRDGCRIECKDGTVEIGEWLEIEAPGVHEQRAQVRWALLGSAGVRFDL